MRHDVGAPLERAAVDRRGEGVVDDQRYAVVVCYACGFLDVEHLYAGVRDRFAEQQFRVGAESCGDLFLGSILVDKGYFDTHLGHRDGEKVERAAVHGRCADKMVSRRTEVQDGVKVRCLSRRGEHRGDTSFERGDFGRYRIVGRILQTCIEVAAFFEVEQAGHLVARFVFERGALVDRKHARLPFFRRPARLYAQRGRFQFFVHLSLFAL